MYQARQAYSISKWLMLRRPTCTIRCHLTLRAPPCDIEPSEVESRGPAMRRRVAPLGARILRVISEEYLTQNKSSPATFTLPPTLAAAPNTYMHFSRSIDRHGCFFHPESSTTPKILGVVHTSTCMYLGIARGVEQRPVHATCAGSVGA